MGDFISTTDLGPFATIETAKANAMIADAEAMAKLVAPCITDVEFEHEDAVKAILREAILRRNDAGSGAVTTQTAGPFSQAVDTSRPRRGLFWPSEIEQLQDLCSDTGNSGAFSVDTVANGVIVHADVCSLNFGADYCSCGAILTGAWPLWEEP